MRVKLKGVASATKKLANGKRVKYRYAWRGPRSEGHPGDRRVRVVPPRAMQEKHRQ